ncbi:MAG: hypothetical protein WBL50_19880 [Candidatus Acidiferrum sp.]
MMRHRKRNAIAVFVVALLLFAVQAGLWVQSTNHARSETDKQNIEGHHPPNEMAGIAGMFLLVVAGAIAAIPSREMASKRSR